MVVIKIPGVITNISTDKLSWLLPRGVPLSNQDQVPRQGGVQGGSRVFERTPLLVSKRFYAPPGYTF